MLAWLASASAALMLMVAADAALQIGMGAAKGLGMGPLLHLLRECRDSGQQISVLKVQMAVDLARDASACCRELPEVLEPPRWWKNTDDWPPHVVDLLTSFTAIAKQTMSLCKMGAEAVVTWAEVASESCLGGQKRRLATIAFALDNVSRAVSSAAFLASERLKLIQLVLDALQDRVERHLSGFKLLQAVSSGISLSKYIGAEDRIQESEPALLVRFFCAASATALLELRALVLATHTSWFENALSTLDDGKLILEKTASDELHIRHLQVSADFLQPRVLENEGVLKRLKKERPSGSLILQALAEVVNQSLGAQALPDLVILDLSAETSYSQAMYFAEEVEQHLPAGVKVLWLEEYFIKNGPQLTTLFNTVAEQRDEDLRTKVVFRPAFGLHTRDSPLWDKAPSLAKQHCASAKRCWRMKPCERATAAPPEPLEGDRLPLDVGCWFRLPSGCPGSTDSALQIPSWRRDKWGEEAFDARTDATACLDLRRQAFIEWCGVVDVQMHFVSSSSASNCRMKIADAFQAVVRGNELHGLWRFNAQAKPTAQPFSSYLWWHSKTLEQLRKEGRSNARALVWACQPSFPCGGHGDRLKGIVAAFILAVLTGRLFFLDAPDPWDLKVFLEPNLLDWRLAGLAGTAGGRHVLWDHDHFEDTYLNQLLSEEEPVWVIYTNKKSLLGPILRHPVLSERAEIMQLLNMPYLTKQVWSILFRPTDALERHWGKLRLRLGEGFIALHHRSGDIPAGFGMVNGEADVRSNDKTELLRVLTCAHAVERSLKLPPATRWYLASDNAAVERLPQVQNWYKAGKLVLPDQQRRAHLAAESLVPPCGSSQVHVNQSPLQVLPAAASLSRVADAWAASLATRQLHKNNIAIENGNL